jgi:hypothetical protein
MDAAALQAEVERLRAANARLGRRADWRRRGRRAAKVALLVLGCGLAVLSLVAIWLRVTLLDTDRYVQTVAPLAAQRSSAPWPSSSRPRSTRGSTTPG